MRIRQGYTFRVFTGQCTSLRFDGFDYSGEPEFISSREKIDFSQFGWRFADWNHVSKDHSVDPDGITPPFIQQYIPPHVVHFADALEGAQEAKSVFDMKTNAGLVLGKNAR